MVSTQAPAIEDIQKLVSLAGRTILVAEPDVRWRTALRDALAAEGAKVACLSSAGEVAAAALEIETGLALVSDAPPELDAIAVLGKLGDAGTLTVVIAEPDAPRRLDAMLRRGAFSCVLRTDPEATVPLCVAGLKNAIAVRELNGRIRSLSDQLRRQNESFHAIVTERTKRLLQAYGELKRLDQLKLDLITLISHQIRTPLCTILGHTEMIRAGRAADPEELEFMLTGIHSQGLRLARFVEDATAYLSCRVGAVTCRQSEFALVRAVEQAHDRVREKALSKEIEIEIDCPADLAITSDLERVTEVVQRILDNAVTYSPKRGRVIVLARKATGAAVIEIQDEGLGIEPELLDRLFKPFELARDLRHHSDGNGLSLALCRELLKLLGGRVTIQSRGKGLGCLVQIGLPLQPGNAEEHAVAGGNAVGAKDATDRGPGF